MPSALSKALVKKLLAGKPFAQEDVLRDEYVQSIPRGVNFGHYEGVQLPRGTVGYRLINDRDGHGFIPFDEPPDDWVRPYPGYVANTRGPSIFFGLGSEEEAYRKALEGMTRDPYWDTGFELYKVRAQDEPWAAPSPYDEGLEAVSGALEYLDRIARVRKK